MVWNYNAQEAVEHEKEQFKSLEEGNYVVRIETIEDIKASTGADMWKIKLSVSGVSNYLFFNLVFSEKNTKFTNFQIKRIFESFEINSMDEIDWIAKVGFARVIQEEYKGKMQNKIQEFIKVEDAEKLGLKKEFKDVPRKAKKEAITDNSVSDSEDIPF